MRAPSLTRIIKTAATRSGYTMPEVAKMTGIKYDTLIRTRMNDPGSWRVFELSAVFRVLDFTEDEISEIMETIRKGGKKIA